MLLPFIVGVIDIVSWLGVLNDFLNIHALGNSGSQGPDRKMFRYKTFH